VTKREKRRGKDAWLARMKKKEGWRLSNAVSLNKEIIREKRSAEGRERGGNRFRQSKKKGEKKQTARLSMPRVTLAEASGDRGGDQDRPYRIRKGGRGKQKNAARGVLLLKAATGRSADRNPLRARDRHKKERGSRQKSPSRREKKGGFCETQGGSAKRKAPAGEGARS